MPPIVPNRFLVRVCHPCPFVKDVPDTADDADHLVDLPESARLHNFADLDAQANFADVRLAWNDFGLAVQVQVTGKDQPPAGDAARPWASDGLTLWIDTRDARASHRASRYCHQFHFLPAGGGADHDEPAVAQTKINRAQQDAPLADPADIPFRAVRTKGGYRLEAFLPAVALTGYDPEQHPRLGVYYVVRDQELGDQFLSVNGDFPFAYSNVIPSVSGGGTTTAGGSASRIPSAAGGGTSTRRTTGTAGRGWGRVATGARGCGGRYGWGSGCAYGYAGYAGWPHGAPAIGYPPTGGHGSAPHPAPDRPGTSTNHIATPATTPATGAPPHFRAFRMRVASVRTTGDLLAGIARPPEGQFAHTVL